MKKNKVTRNRNNNNNTGHAKPSPNFAWATAARASGRSRPPTPAPASSSNAVLATPSSPVQNRNPPSNRLRAGSAVPPPAVQLFFPVPAARERDWMAARSKCFSSRALFPVGRRRVAVVELLLLPVLPPGEADGDALGVTTGPVTSVVFARTRCQEKGRTNERRARAGGGGSGGVDGEQRELPSRAIC